MLNILLPRLCTACRRPLKKWEECLCLTCLAELPLTRFHEELDNPLARVFWGRVQLEQAVAWFYFRKGSAYQDVLHQLKYEGRPDIGVSLGREFGNHLRHSRQFSIPDAIIPVPLHPKKMRRRGYNQSAEIARGLAHATGAPLMLKNLVRLAHTDTQTRKSRFDRYLNVTGRFGVANPDSLQGLHLLLIDDVVTTGATLEACAETLLTIPGARVSVGALCWAKD
jgi:ComF family protein